MKWRKIKWHDSWSRARRRGNSQRKRSFASVISSRKEIILYKKTLKVIRKCSKVINTKSKMKTNKIARKKISKTMDRAKKLISSFKVKKTTTRMQAIKKTTHTCKWSSWNSKSSSKYFIKNS